MTRRVRAKGAMPASARPWGREEDMTKAREASSPSGKAMGACRPSARFDAPFALDPRKAPQPPPGVFGYLKPFTPNPEPCTLNPKSYTLKPKPLTLNPKP